MNAGVVGEFGVEGRGENVALSQTDHTPINLGLDRGVRPDIGDERPTNEHERKVLDVTEIGRGGERTELPTVSVAANRGVEGAEVHVVVVFQSLREQNHSGARAEHRLAGGDVRGDRLEQTGGAQQFALCGRLAAGQNHAVDG